MKYGLRLFVLLVVVLVEPVLASEQAPQAYTEGVHYTVLEKPQPTRDLGKIEVVKAFSYGCPPCLVLEPAIAEWLPEQGADIDFWQFPAVWNEPMAVYARTFYAAEEIGVLGKVHWPLFSALVVEQRKLSTASELAEFMGSLGVDQDAFLNAYLSTSVRNSVAEARTRARGYNLAGAPELIVNGKYRVDRMRAGGLEQMLDVVDYLVQKERQFLAAR